MKFSSDKIKYIDDRECCYVDYWCLSGKNFEFDLFCLNSNDLLKEGKGELSYSSKARIIVGIK